VAVWLSFGIHGNEASPSEAALGLAYHFAAASDESTSTLLAHSVVLIDPCLNPDGRERYVSWLGDVLGSRPDPAPGSREHDEPWPGGRENHYFFDLNRDWAWLTQVESKSRAHAYLAWLPQVHVDFHEMWANSSYFFFPPERPLHPLYPREVMEWARVFGRANAAAFDARGWRYFTEETFDLYYPGYGDTLADLPRRGGNDLRASRGGQAGLNFRRADGDTLTLEHGPPPLRRRPHHGGDFRSRGGRSGSSTSAGSSCRRTTRAGRVSLPPGTTLRAPESWSRSHGRMGRGVPLGKRLSRPPRL
jgi:hypothetical protein